MTEKSCLDNYNFLALAHSFGLDPYIDGILGLSPNKGPEFAEEHVLPQMRAGGMIDEASVAFSIANSFMDDESYAMFGSYNPEQVVGGE